MGMFDTVKGVPEGYDEQIKAWGCNMDVFEVGCHVGAVNGYMTYSIRLNSHRMPPPPPRYLLVLGGVLQGVDADRPWTDKAGDHSPYPVFSKWGGPENEVSPMRQAIGELIVGGELLGQPPTTTSIRMLFEETRERLWVSCKEDHEHTALSGCFTAREDEKDIIICKLCETILKDRATVTEILTKLEDMRLP